MHTSDKQAETGLGFPRKLRVVLVLAILAATFVFPATAGASNWSGVTWEGSNPCAPGADVNRMDGGTTKVQYKNLESLTQLALNETVWATYDPTDLGIVIVTSGFDIQARDWNYSTFCGRTWHSSGGPGSAGVKGLYNCFKLKSSGVYAGGCDKARIRFDTSYLNSGLSTTQRTALACHEFGHAVGLYHRDGNCISGGGTPLPTKVLSSHSLGHLNDNYVEP